MAETLTHEKKVKVHFLVLKETNFGEAVYVIGAQKCLGSWDISECLRLNWNSDNYWSGFVEFCIKDIVKMQFKYFVSHFDGPSQEYLFWEDGDFNRQILLSPEEDNIIIENIWSQNKICLNLLVPKSEIKKGTEIYLAGGCKELGNWKSRLKLNQIPTLTLECEEILTTESQKITINDYYVFSICIWVSRSLENFNYYLIKGNSEELVSDRVPMRDFQIYCVENKDQPFLYVSNKAGNYELLELSKFTQLHFAKITDNILMGEFIETFEDVRNLRKEGVNAILYLSPKQHKKSSLVPQNLVKMICEENKIDYMSFIIDISNQSEILDQAKVAVSILSDILECEKNVYVFCDDSLLSIILVAVYLSFLEGTSLKRAMEFVRERYPIHIVDKEIMDLVEVLSGDNYFRRTSSHSERRVLSNEMIGLK